MTSLKLQGTAETSSEPHGVGIFSWSGPERRTKRYGAFNLESENYDGDAHVSNWLSIPASLIGKRVKAVLRVVQARDSGHQGDMFLNILPSRPEIGEEITLGPGILQLEDVEDMTKGIVLVPEDGRLKFWLDPRLLYRLHDQTVELRLMETTEAAPTLDFESAPEGALATGDGFLQVSGDTMPTRLYPNVTPVEGVKGTFKVGFDTRRGQRVKTSLD